MKDFLSGCCDKNCCAEKVRILRNARRTILDSIHREQALVDRANPLFSSDYQFREIYALATAAENEEYVPEKAFSVIEGWVE